MKLQIFRIKIRNSSQKPTVGPTSRISKKLTKSEHPFWDESNHIKIIEFQHRIVFQIRNFRFKKVLQKSQFLPSKSEINDEYWHGFMKYNHLQIENTYPSQIREKSLWNRPNPRLKTQNSKMSKNGKLSILSILPRQVACVKCDCLIFSGKQKLLPTFSKSIITFCTNVHMINGLHFWKLESKGYSFYVLKISKFLIDCEI